MINELLEFLDSSESEDFFSTSSSSSSSESDESEPEEFASIQNYIGTINAMGEKQFKENFRLNRPTVLHLIEMYAASDHCPIDGTGGRCRIGAEKEIYAFLWYIGNTCTFRELGNLFGLRKSSIWRCVLRVSKWLISIGHHFIRWPQDGEINRSQFANVHGAIGVIDVAAVKIKRPKVNGQDYFNRKKYYSISLQAVVDANRRIIDIFCGEPGSLHDARVLRRYNSKINSILSIISMSRSGLYARATANQAIWFPNRTFIIADSAYPSLPWLVPVYKNYGNLTNHQKKFNYLISSVRVLVEHVFGLLKGRFRRLLHFTENRQIGFVVNIVICACILHNICIDQNDDTVWEHESDDDSEYSEGDSEEEERDLDRREELFRQMLNRNMLR